MNGSLSDVAEDVHEWCAREGHTYRTEGGTGALIPICVRCGWNDEDGAHTALPAGATTPTSVRRLFG